MNALVRELNSGGSGLRGTFADGIIHVGETDLNNALASAAAATSGVKLEILAGNRILARFGVVHATVVLPPVSDLAQSPALTFALGSIAVAWGLKRVLKESYVRIQGRYVTVALDAVPVLRPYRELWRYVRQVEMTTTAGVLTMRFRVDID
jgi:hypothetical protein